jgi:hypothetical protein
MRVSGLQIVAMLALRFASSHGGETGDRVTSGKTAGEIMKQQASRRAGEHLTVDDTILDVLNHPAFAGFSRLLLPWDDRTYDNTMRLRNLDALLPYHSHVDPRTVVNALNRMIDDVSRSQPVFYDVYTKKERSEQRTRANTGCSFFAVNRERPLPLRSGRTACRVSEETTFRSRQQW